MVLRLYGYSQATCAKRVVTVLKEKEVPFEFHSVDISQKEQKLPEYLEKQPFGQVPYLDDNGFIVFESRAIAAYIASKYAGQGTQDLIPTELKARALYDQAASIETSNFDTFAAKLVSEKVFKPMFGMKTDEELVATLIQGLDAKLNGYEVILSKQKYLAGNQLTLADLFHLPSGDLLPAAGVTFLESESRPNVARWWKDISSRPSWLAVKDGIKV